MRIFEPKKWNGKINFIDDNNVFVGFDYNGQCCESFGYFLTQTKPIPTVKVVEIEGADFPGYNFDTSFKEDGLFPDRDSGGSVTFRLANEAGEEMFLTLYNHHNGYYGHGWDMRSGGEDGAKISTGDL